MSRLTLHILFCFSLFPCVCGLTCNISHEAAGTRYTFPDFQATDCEYSWSNTNMVLANDVQTNESVVLTNTNRSLLTNTCFDIIYYERFCWSERRKREATCSTNCSVSAPNLKEKEHGTVMTLSPTPPTTAGDPRHHWFAAIPAVLTALLVIYLLLKQSRGGASGNGDLPNAEALTV